MFRSIVLAALALMSPWTIPAHSQEAPANDRPPPDRPAEPPRGPEGRFLFVSPMGEPFRVERPERAWFAGADANGDGRIDQAEFRVDAARFFTLLDRQGDGEIDPGDIEVYEMHLLPEVRVADGGGPAGAGGRGSRGPGDGPGGGPSGGMGGGPGGVGSGAGGPPGGGRGGNRGGDQGSDGSSSAAQGAARFSYLDMPEPVTPADTSFNRGIDPREFARAADQRFALLDRNHDGALTAAELPAINTRNRDRGGLRGRPPGPPPNARQGDRPKMGGEQGDDQQEDRTQGGND